MRVPQITSWMTMTWYWFTQRDPGVSIFRNLTESLLGSPRIHHLLALHLAHIDLWPRVCCERENRQDVGNDRKTLKATPTSHDFPSILYANKKKLFYAAIRFHSCPLWGRKLVIFSASPELSAFRTPLFVLGLSHSFPTFSVSSRVVGLN